MHPRRQRKRSLVPMEDQFKDCQVPMEGQFAVEFLLLHYQNATRSTLTVSKLSIATRWQRWLHSSKLLQAPQAHSWRPRVAIGEHGEKLSGDLVIGDWSRVQAEQHSLYMFYGIQHHLGLARLRCWKCCRAWPTKWKCCSAAGEWCWK